MEQKINELHAKIDQQRTAENKTSSLLIEGLKDVQEKINLPSSHIAKVVPHNRPSYALNLNKSRGTSSTDPLNWSFSFSQSAIPNDNVELYQLLNGFEQNTWTSLDYLRHKLNENTDTVTNIESMCKELKAQIIQHRLDSPVTNSIKLDNLQTIQDKCEVIERNIRILESTIRKISENQSPMISKNLDNQRKSCNPTTEHGGDVVDEATIRLQQMSEKLTSNVLLNEEDTFDQEIYVGRLPTSTTCENVRDYISHRNSINANNMRIYRLTKKHQDLSKLSFISFKIETNKEIAHQLIRSEAWPSNVCVKFWKRKNEPIPELKDNLTSENFLSRAKPDHQQL